MSIDQSVNASATKGHANTQGMKRRGFYLKFKKPSSSEGVLFGFWYRVIIVLVSMIPSWITLVTLGSWNNYKLDLWMFFVAAGLAIIPLTVGEILRRTVYEQSLQIESEVVEVRITRSGLKITSEDQEKLEKFENRFSDDGGYFYRSIGKRIFDLTVVLIMLPALLPIMVIIAIFISRDGYSPIYMHKRIGYKGRSFRSYKFRTMVPDADKVLMDIIGRDVNARLEWMTNYRLTNDPRFTRIGLFLKKTSLDELPQALNVLKGEMSLVGPRAMSLDEARLYKSKVYYNMKPGLTGLWQISNRNYSTFATREVYDKAYSERMSFSVDVSIIANTFRAIARDKLN